MKINNKLFAILMLIWIICLIGSIFAVVYYNKPEQFGYILIDPNGEDKAIFTVCLFGDHFTEGDDWINQTSFDLFIFPKYNFSEKALHIDVSAFVQDLNITFKFVSIEIIEENYFIKTPLFDCFGTYLLCKINEQSSNYTIQPLMFYKWGVLD